LIEILENSEIGKKFKSCFGKMEVIKSPKNKGKGKGKGRKAYARSQKKKGYRR
jgi:hypothetical protein